MFSTDLTRDYAAACSFGLEPRGFFEAGLEGALCDEPTKARLRAGARPSTGTRLAGVEVP